MFRPFISFAIANIRDLYQTAKEKMWGNMVYSFPPYPNKDEIFYQNIILFRIKIIYLQ